MFLKEFILRFVRLNNEFVFIYQIKANAISLRFNKAGMSCFNDLSDLLSTIIEKEDGEFSFSFNMINKTLDIKFIEAEC